MPDHNAAKEKWDARYRDKCEPSLAVADVLLENSQYLPDSGMALDLACGLGGNALFLAQRGFQVDAWDISSVAIERVNAAAVEKGLTLHTQVRDCVARPPEPDTYDVIVVSRFLERELCPAISAALKPGGLLFYQTFTPEKEEGVGPSNPRFLLRQGELPELFPKLKVIAYRDGAESTFVAEKRQ